jgi:ATP-dependent DNA ligase
LQLRRRRCRNSAQIHENALGCFLPNFLEPMQATLVDSTRPGDWIYEIKFDGYRAIALRGDSETRMEH